MSDHQGQTNDTHELTESSVDKSFLPRKIQRTAVSNRKTHVPYELRSHPNSEETRPRWQFHITSEAVPPLGQV
jgi:hypothetical protein